MDLFSGLVAVEFDARHLGLDELADLQGRLRSEAQGVCGKVFAAAGVALPPTVQQIEAP